MWRRLCGNSPAFSQSLLGDPSHPLRGLLGSVVLDQAAVACGLVLVFVDQVVEQRVQTADPRKVGSRERTDLVAPSSAGSAAAAISTCTPSEEPAAAAVSHHCSPVSGGVAARAQRSKPVWSPWDLLRLRL